MPRDAWIVLAGDTLSAIGSGLTLPFLLIYLSRIRGIDVFTAGLAVSVVALAGFVGNPAGGWLADRIGTKRALGLGLAAAALGAFLVVAVRDPATAFAAAAIVGFGAALITPAQDALLAVVVDRDARPTVFAVRNMTLNAGYGLGAVIAALVVDLASPASFEVLYAADGLTFLAFIPILAVIRPRPSPTALLEGERAVVGPPVAAPGYAAVLRDRVFLRVWLLLAVLVTIGFAQTLSGFPAYATIVGGISAAGLSIAFAANTLTVVVAQFPVLRFLEGRRRTTGIVLACLCWAVAWTITLVSGGVGQAGGAVLWFTLAMVIFAIGETLLAPSQAALINDLASDELRGRYNGLYALAWTSGLAIGPALAAAAIAGGQGAWFFGGLIAACGLTALAAARLARHLPRGINVVRLRAPEPGDAAGD